MVTAVERRVFPHGLPRYFVQITVVFALQFAAGKVGDILQSTSNGGIGPVWPAAGIALAALLVWGSSVWTGVFAGALLLGLLGRLPLWTAIVYATGTALAAWFGASLLRRRGFDNSLSRLSDTISLITLGAFGSSIVSASIGVCALYWAHVRGWSSFGVSWLIYFLGDATGVLLVTPLVLTFPDLIQIRNRNQITELGSLLLLLTVPYLIFYGIPPASQEILDISVFAVLPFVMFERAGGIDHPLDRYKCDCAHQAPCRTLCKEAAADKCRPVRCVLRCDFRNRSYLGRRFRRKGARGR